MQEDSHNARDKGAVGRRRLDGVSTVVGVLAGVVTTVATSFAIFGNPFADDPRDIEARTEPAAVAARQVEKCMDRHRLQGQSAILGGTYGHRITFQHCDWPPVAPSSTDGYTEILDTVAVLPKYNADLYNTVDSFRAPCDRLEVTFVLNHMNGRQFVTGVLDVERVFLVGFRNENSTKLALTRLDRVPEDVNLPLPSATSRSFHVLHSGHFALFDAKCVDSP